MQKYNTIYEINTLFDHNLTLLKVHLKIESFYSKKPVVLTIGTFDGVHAGHLAVIDVLKAKANKINGETALLTFSPHPRVVLHPDNHNLRLLNTRKEKEVRCACDEKTATRRWCKNQCKRQRDLEIWGLHVPWIFDFLKGNLHALLRSHPQG